MQKFKILLPAFILTISFSFACAEPDKATMTTQETTSGKTNVNIGPGMTVITLNGTNILVPKDMIVTKEKGRIKKEDIGAYLARKFDAIETRLNNIDSGQRDLKKELEQLRQRVETFEKERLSNTNAAQGK